MQAQLAEDEEARRREEDGVETRRKMEMEREDKRRRAEVERRRVEDEKEAAREKAIKEGELRIRRVLEEEFKARMAKFEEQQRVEREEAERKFAQRIAAEKESHSKALETAMMDAKNEANRTISELNREVVAERGKLVAEQQARSSKLEEEWRGKEERLQRSLLEVEGREQQWQVRETFLLLLNLLGGDQAGVEYEVDVVDVGGESRGACGGAEAEGRGFQNGDISYSPLFVQLGIHLLSLTCLSRWQSLPWKLRRRT